MSGQIQSKALLDRRVTHHLAAEMLRQFLSAVRVSDHATGLTKVIGVNLIGTTQRDNAQGWIDSPGMALQWLGGHRERTAVANPTIEKKGDRFLVTGASPTYVSNWRLSVKSANLFDSTDIDGQIEELFRARGDSGRIKKELIGYRVYLEDELLPNFQLCLNQGDFSHSMRSDHVMSYVDLEVSYPLIPVEVDLPALIEVGYHINPPGGTP